MRVCVSVGTSSTAAFPCPKKSRARQRQTQRWLQPQLTRRRRTNRNDTRAAAASAAQSKQAPACCLTVPAATTARIVRLRGDLFSLRQALTVAYTIELRARKLFNFESYMFKFAVHAQAGPGFRGRERPGSQNYQLTSRAAWYRSAPRIPELVAYDQAKQTFLKAGMPDNIPTHILSGLTAGLAATLLGSPVDVIKVKRDIGAALCVDCSPARWSANQRVPSIHPSLKRSCCTRCAYVCHYCSQFIFRCDPSDARDGRSRPGGRHSRRTRPRGRVQRPD